MDYEQVVEEVNKILGLTEDEINGVAELQREEERAGFGNPASHRTSYEKYA